MRPHHLDRQDRDGGLVVTPARRARNGRSSGAALALTALALTAAIVAAAASAPETSSTGSTWPRTDPQAEPRATRSGRTDWSRRDPTSAFVETAAASPT